MERFSDEARKAALMQRARCDGGIYVDSARFLLELDFLDPVAREVAVRLLEDLVADGRLVGPPRSGADGLYRLTEDEGLWEVYGAHVQKAAHDAGDDAVADLLNQVGYHLEHRRADFAGALIRAYDGLEDDVPAHVLRALKETDRV